jgi:hypothetical protein
MFVMFGGVIFNRQLSFLWVLTTYVVYIYQFIQYYTACGSYIDYLYRGLLPTKKLLNQGFILVKLK